MQKDLKMTIAENLKKDREAKGLTHSEYAKRIGSNRTTMYMYESGKRMLPTEVLFRIFQEYGTTPNQMLGVKD